MRTVIIDEALGSDLLKFHMARGNSLNLLLKKQKAHVFSACCGSSWFQYILDEEKLEKYSGNPTEWRLILGSFGTGGWCNCTNRIRGEGHG